MIGRTANQQAAPVLRRGLLALGAVTTGALAVELAAERHWTQPTQLIAWAALVVGAIAIALAAWASTRRLVLLGRVLAITVMLSGAYGVWEHIESNHDAGELDRNYTETWETLPATTRWWLAASKTVGPSPPLAPGALAQVGLCVVLATVRHPALAARGRRDGDLDEGLVRSG
jgi:hypothetical protein